MSIKDKINSNYKIILYNNHETIVNINNHKLRFIKNAHKYFIDSYEVPSVSSIMKYMLPDIYKDIDSKIIKVASNRGDVMHYEIENFEHNGIKGFTEEFKNYLSLKEELNIKTVENELFVIYVNGEVPMFAGRLDLVYERDNKLGILDFKRTRDYHEDRVSMQLNLYRLAFMQSFGLEVSELACMRLRDFLKDFIEVKIDMLKTIDAIDNYKMRKVK